MPGNCCICGQMKSADCKISLHRFPKKPEIRKKWLDGLELTESDINSESRVCSMHFRDGNIKNIPSIHIGIKFADSSLFLGLLSTSCDTGDAEQGHVQDAE